eukprot:9469551-Pyramimonas_sp.AAC.2
MVAGALRPRGGAAPWGRMARCASPAAGPPSVFWFTEKFHRALNVLGRQGHGVVPFNPSTPPCLRLPT